MGDRAWITTWQNANRRNVRRLGVYLHWDGAPERVKAIVSYCDARGYRSPEYQEDYAWARLCQVACNMNTYVAGGHIADGLSVGVNFAAPNTYGGGCDNGVYLLKGWKIVGRYDVDSVDNDTLYELMCMIDDRYPEDVRLGRDEIRAYVYEGKRDRRV